MAETISHDEYTEVVCAPGETWTYALSDGETYENVLIDITADGADLQIDARGQDMTVRNIGVRGTYGHDDGQALLAGGENVTFDTIYLGDGGIPGREKGCWVDHGMTDGPLTFRNVHVAGFPNNGIYGSPTADLQGGVMHIHDSYFDSNNISQFKIGSPLGTCEVTNTVIRTDNDTPHNGFNQINKRGLWALDNHVIVDGCDILGSIEVENGCVADVTDTRWEGAKQDDAGTINGSPTGTPDLTPPTGTPMTAEAAATGSGSDGGDTQTEAESPLSDALTVTTTAPYAAAPNRTAGDIATTIDGVYGNSAASAATLDGFERSSLGYSGGPADAFATTTAAAHTGDRALTRTNPDAPSNAWIAAGPDDPPIGIAQGDRVRFRVWSETGVDSATSAQLGVAFGIDDPTAPSQNCYYVPLRPASNDHVGISRAVNGEYSTLAAVEPLDYPGGEWWAITVEWRTNDTIAVEVHDAAGDLVGETSVTDDTHSGNDGTVGWFGYLPADANVYADHLERL